MIAAGCSRPHLLLFTHFFPYGAGEAFLESEVDYLAAAFDQVTIVPRVAEGALRAIPRNFRVDDSLAARHRTRSKVGSMARALACDLFYRELRGRPQTLLQPPVADRLVAHAAAAVRLAKWLEEFVDTHRVSLGDVLCYTYWLGPETTGVGMVRRRNRAVRLVSRAHGFDLYAERYDPPYMPLQRFALAATDATFAVSVHGREYLRSTHSDLADKIHVARLGVRDPGTVAAQSEQGTLRILTCSRIEEVKRLDLAVEGIAAAARQHPRLAIDWTHFGDGSERESVRAAAQRLLPASVTWSLRGELPNSVVLEHYRRNPVDVFLNVSWSEGVPVSMMEAQSFGVPVIGTAVGGVPEIVDDETGVLLSPDPTPAEIASALSLFLSDASVVRALREASRARWQARYSAAANFGQFVKTVQSLG